MLFCRGKREPSRGASLVPSGQFTFRAAPGVREKRRDEQEGRPALLFVMTGVVRIGRVIPDGPVVPAPRPGS